MDNNKKDISLDILRYIEDLSNKINQLSEARTQSIFRRYPITFGLVVLVGVVLLSEGLKEVILSLDFFKDHPWYMLFSGLLILIITGRVYKKLNK